MSSVITPLWLDSSILGSSEATIAIEERKRSMSLSTWPYQGPNALRSMSKLITMPWWGSYRM